MRNWWVRYGGDLFFRHYCWGWQVLDRCKDDIPYIAAQERRWARQEKQEKLHAPFHFLCQNQNTSMLLFLSSLDRSLQYGIYLEVEANHNKTFKKQVRHAAAKRGETLSLPVHDYGPAAKEGSWEHQQQACSFYGISGLSPPATARTMTSIVFDRGCV